MTILAEKYDFPQLIVRKKFHSDWEKQKPLIDPYPVVGPNDLFGIEVEVENMPNGVLVDKYWDCKQDNSLRNHGMELVSIPLRGYQVEYALNVLVDAIYAHNNPIFSPRTSVHVHLNARDLTEDEVMCLVLLYCIFEKHFFHIAGTRRESSIFCVPLYKTQYLWPFSDLLQGPTTRWHKYSALNLGTLFGTDQLPKYGTIEFRHLYGTSNKKIILDWINNISLLKQAAKRTTYKELLQTVRDMNTTSSYIALYENTFKEYANLRIMDKYDFESCVSFVKRWEWGSKLNTKYPVQEISAYYYPQGIKKEPVTPTLPKGAILDQLAYGTIVKYQNELAVKVNTNKWFAETKNNKYTGILDELLAEEPPPPVHLTPAQTAKKKKAKKKVTTQVNPINPPAHEEW